MGMLFSPLHQALPSCYILQYPLSKPPYPLYLHQHPYKTLHKPFEGHAINAVVNPRHARAFSPVEQIALVDCTKSKARSPRIQASQAPLAHVPRIPTPSTPPAWDTCPQLCLHSIHSTLLARYTHLHVNPPSEQEAEDGFALRV